MPKQIQVEPELRLADKEMCQLFYIDFKLSEGDVPIRQVGWKTTKQSSRLANEFAAKVPRLGFSPAEVLSFLLAKKAISWIGSVCEDIRIVRKAYCREPFSRLVADI